MIGNIETPDVMIVFSEVTANSATDKQYKEKTLFSSKGMHDCYNDCYSYFLSRCDKMGINAACTSLKDIIASGLFQSYWTFDNKWIRNNEKAYSEIIYDKFTPNTVKQKNKLKLLRSSKSVYLFSNKKMKFIFRNKLNTYKFLSDFSIPTVGIANSSKRHITQAIKKLEKLLKNHKNCNDFSNELVLKDITGAGGFNIHKIKSNRFAINKIKKFYALDKKREKKIDYILQPYINFDKGFVFGKYKGFIDLRVIIINRKIKQTYIRIAKKKDFRCNIHQGGNLVYIPIKEIPKNVRLMTSKICKKLESELNFEHTIYALDFIRSNNGNLYLVEGNSSPGFMWADNNKDDEIKSKELIDLIVDELKSVIKERINK